MLTRYEDSLLTSWGSFFVILQFPTAGLHYQQKNRHNHQGCSDTLYRRSLGELYACFQRIIQVVGAFNINNHNGRAGESIDFTHNVVDQVVTLMNVRCTLNSEAFLRVAIDYRYRRHVVIRQVVERLNVDLKANIFSGFTLIRHLVNEKMVHYRLILTVSNVYL